jgi:molecular chaperone GrpE
MTAKREQETVAQEAAVSTPEVEDTGTEPAGEAEVQPAATPEAQTPAAAEAEQVAVDLDELLSKAQERDEYLALAQRTQADFENYRKRMARDVAAAESRGLAKAAKELLPALDNLEHALKAANEHPEDGLAEGIRLLHAEVSAALGRLGIEAYSPAGEPFDPEQHEAMATQPGDGAAPGTVIEVFQQGYRIGGSVIRPARVVVAG